MGWAFKLPVRLSFLKYSDVRGIVKDSFSLVKKVMTSVEHYRVLVDVLLLLVDVLLVRVVGRS